MSIAPGFEQVVVTITGGIVNGQVMVRDVTGREFEVMTMLPKGTGQPEVGEQWLVTKKLGRWTLDVMLVSTESQTPVITGSLAEPGETLQQVVEALAKHGLVVDQTTDKEALDPELDDDTDPAIYDDTVDGPFVDEYVVPGEEIEPEVEVVKKKVRKEAKNQKDRQRRREQPVTRPVKVGRPATIAVITANLGRGVSTAEFTRNAKRVHDKFPVIPRFIGWQEIDEADNPDEHNILNNMFAGEGSWGAFAAKDPIFVPKPWKIRNSVSTVGAPAGGGGLGPQRLINQVVVYNPQRPDIPPFVMMNMHFHRTIPQLMDLWWGMVDVLRERARYWYGRGYSILWTGDVNKHQMPKVHRAERVIFGKGIDQISVIEHPKGARFRVQERGSIPMSIDGHDGDWVKMTVSGRPGVVPVGTRKPKERNTRSRGGREQERKPKKDVKSTYSWLSVATYNQIAIIGPQRVVADLEALEKSGVDVLALQEAGWVARGETYAHNRPQEFEMFRPSMVPENTIMWRSETCELVASGEHLLVEGSGPETEMPPRGVAWVRLRHIDSRRVFTVLGTHLDPGAAFQGYFSAEPGRTAEHVARYKASMATMQTIVEAHKRFGPVIVAGCFNADYRRDSRLRNNHLPFRTFKSLAMKSTYQALGEPDKGTRDSGALLDAQYFFTKEKTLLTPSSQRILGGYASDNSPLVVVYKVKDKARATRRRQDQPDVPATRQPREDEMKKATLVTANMDFRKGGDEAYMRHLKGLTGKGVLFTQEVGHGRASTKLRGVGTKIDHRQRIEVGDVGAHRGVARAMIKIGRHNVQLFCVHGLHVGTSGQAAQDAYYAELEDRIKRLTDRDVEWVVGGDFNRGVGSVATQLGGTAYGDGVDGFVISDGLKVTKHGKNSLGMNRGWTDHPAYRITIEAKPERPGGTPAQATTNE